MRLFALLLGIALGGPDFQDRQKDVAEAWERIQAALGSDDPQALPRAVTQERAHLYPILTWILTIDAASKSDKPVEAGPIVKVVLDAFDQLPQPTEPEKRQVTALRRRWKSNQKLSAEQAAAYLKAIHEIQSARSLVQKGRWADAEAAFTGFLKSDEPFDDPDQKSEALQTLGELRLARSKFDEALEAWTRALEIAQEEGNRPREARLRTGMGVAESKRGRYAESIRHQEEAQKIYRELGNAGGEAVSLDNSGVVYAKCGLHRDALKKHLQAIEILRKTPFENDLGVATNNAAQAYTELGRYEEAIQACAAALDLLKKTGDRSGVGIALDNLGVLYSKTGQYREALKRHEAALEIFRELKDARAESVALSNIGVIYGHLGRYDEAVRFHLLSLEVKDKSGDAAGRATVLANIASYYGELGRLNEAREKFEEALKIHRALGDVSGEAAVISNLAVLLGRMDLHDEARKFLERALKLYQEIGNERALIAVLANLAVELHSAGKTAEAIETCGRALDLARRSRDRKNEATIQSDLAVMCLESGRAEEAVEHARQSVELLELLRASLGMMQSEKQAWLQTLRSTYELAASCYLMQNKPEEAFAMMERTRARNLLDLLSSSGAAQQGVPAEKLEKKKMLMGELASARLERESMRGALSRSLSPDDKKVVEARLRDVERGLDEREKELVAIAHEIERDQTIEESKPLAAADIRACLREGEAMVMLNVMARYSPGSSGGRLISRPKILAAILTRDALSVVELDRDSELDRQIQWIREANRLTGRGYAPAEFKKRARALYQALIRPLEPKLSGVRRLLVSPDGPLLSVPFESLVASDSGETYSDFGYLGGRFEVSYVTSGTLLARRRADDSKKGSRFVGFGDPDYGNGRGADMAPGGSERGVVPEDLQSFWKDQVGQERRGWGRLPHSGEEVTECAKLFKDSLCSLGVEASETNAKRLGGADFLHFACHGFVDGSDPIKSALVLTADKENDGYLEAREIADLKLPCELVVLSACDSGQGEMLSGEGLIGLSRAFMIAGARSVVASLWTVSDEGGKEFMVSFYKKLAAGKDKIAALAETKREFAKHEKYSAPYYWAGFVLHGD